MQYKFDAMHFLCLNLAKESQQKEERYNPEGSVQAATIACQILMKYVAHALSFSQYTAALPVLIDLYFQLMVLMGVVASVSAHT